MHNVECIICYVLIAFSVVRMKVLKIEETGMGNDTRYDVKIVDRYKDSISLLSREYLWVPNRCNCPRIQRNKEYIVMGSLVTDSREGRLQLVRNSFVRPFNIANENRMRNLLKRINCDKYGWIDLCEWGLHHYKCQFSCVHLFFARWIVWLIKTREWIFYTALTSYTLNEMNLIGGTAYVYPLLEWKINIFFIWVYH